MWRHNVPHRRTHHAGVYGFHKSGLAVRSPRLNRNQHGKVPYKVMTILTKPCNGSLSQETREMLRVSGGKERLKAYSCVVCGRVVGVVTLKGQWTPERHWPSLEYCRRTSAHDSRPA